LPSKRGICSKLR